jgi:hypothetical protein
MRVGGRRIKRSEREKQRRVIEGKIVSVRDMNYYFLLDSLIKFFKT